MNFCATTKIIALLKKYNICWRSGHAIDMWVGVLEPTDVLYLGMDTAGVCWGTRSQNFGSENEAIAYLLNCVLPRRGR
jgi:hypothetical protein